MEELYKRIKMILGDSSEFFLKLIKKLLVARRWGFKKKTHRLGCKILGFIYPLGGKR